MGLHAAPMVWHRGLSPSWSVSALRCDLYGPELAMAGVTGGEELKKWWSNGGRRRGFAVTGPALHRLSYLHIPPERRPGAPSLATRVASLAIGAGCRIGSLKLQSPQILAARFGIKSSHYLSQGRLLQRDDFWSVFHGITGLVFSFKQEHGSCRSWMDHSRRFSLEDSEMARILPSRGSACAEAL
ncbi:unnamed protein product [Urochloa humidicola]